MSETPRDDIRSVFTHSADFNQLFDAFESALRARTDDIELYRQLFWNKALTPDELCLFGEKLATEFPHLAYDTYMWLASVFELTFFQYDNYDLALRYYEKAAAVNPKEPDPYLDACDCYEPDLNIPPIDWLIDFLKRGAEHVIHPKQLYLRLARLYSITGQEDESLRYQILANDAGTDNPGA